MERQRAVVAHRELDAAEAQLAEKDKENDVVQDSLDDCKRDLTASVEENRKHQFNPFKKIPADCVVCSCSSGTVSILPQHPNFRRTETLKDERTKLAQAAETLQTKIKELSEKLSQVEAEMKAQSEQAAVVAELAASKIESMHLTNEKLQGAYQNKLTLPGNHLLLHLNRFSLVRQRSIGSTNLINDCLWSLLLLISLISIAQIRS